MVFQNILQQLEELVTAFRRNIIGSARIRLTFFYVIVLSITVISVDAIVNYSRTWQFERQLVDLIPNAKMLQDVTASIQQTVNDIRNIDYAIYVVLIGFFGFVSYKISARTLAPVDAVLASQRRFLANAAHELRTPLSIIKTDIEVRLGDPTPPTKESMREDLASISEEVNRMTETINNLLLIANAYHDKKPAFKKIDIAKTLVDACEIILPFAEKNDVHIKVDTHLSVIHIQGNQTAIEQVFVNILKNAVKYTPKNGKVTVHMTVSPRQVYIGINDTGIGIPASALPEVFDPFFRVQNVSDKEGTGLGLTLVKELVELHKGSIELKSIEGKGTTALLSFPRIM